jgi:hypothetical protein
MAIDSATSGGGRLRVPGLLVQQSVSVRGFPNRVGRARPLVISRNARMESYV